MCIRYHAHSMQYVRFLQIKTLNEVVSNGECSNHHKYPSHGHGVHGGRVAAAAARPGSGGNGDGVLGGTNRLRGHHAGRAAEVEQRAIRHGVNRRVS